MVLFPEGGFLRKRRAVSQKYAEKNNLSILHNVSLPRVGALKTILTTVGPQDVPNNNCSTTLGNPNKINLLISLEILIIR